MNLLNYAFQSVSDKGKTQAPLHSHFVRVGEYQFSSSSLHFLTRIYINPLIYSLVNINSTKLNIHQNFPFALQSRVQSSHSIKMLPLTEVKGNC